MSAWSLGIDFGTSFTVAAVAGEGSVHAVDVESNGSDRMPSAVFLTEDGELLVGAAAQHQAVFAPERYEPTPKRALGEGELLLGDRLMSVADLAAAVLRRVYTEACRQQGERAPAELRVTYPADWGETRRAVLIDACQRGGLPTAELVAEPVAAAVRIALQVTPPERHIAVYDFGGGTFDAAVLLRTAAGFEVAGPPVGRDPLGGEDIDQRIIAHIGQLLAEDHAEAWSKLLDPPDVASRRDNAELRREVQRAKETLSEASACQLWVPGVERDLQITRAELEELIGEDIDSTVDALESALSDAGVTAQQLAGLYLVGGSSRIPLVADTLWRRLGVRPSVQDNPKSVVAMGAAGWTSSLARVGVGAAAGVAGAGALGVAAGAGASGVAAGVAASRVPPAPAGTAYGPDGQARGAAADVPASSVTPASPVAATLEMSALDGATVVAAPRIAMALAAGGWPAGYRCVAAFTIDRSGAVPLTVRTRDEPAAGMDTASLAQAALSARAARTPGFRDDGAVGAAVAGVAGGIERRFSMTARGRDVAMLEQYLVVDGRALVIACPLDARSIADSASLVAAAPADSFHGRLRLSCPAGWSVGERVRLQRNGTKHEVSAESMTTGPGVSPKKWCDKQVDAALAQPHARLTARVGARVFDGVAGQIATVVWRDGDRSMITKLGVATLGNEALSVSIALPHAEQQMFASLAQHARLITPVVS